MDVETITTIISATGFPIAMCLILCYYIKDVMNKMDETLDGVKDALNNNTALLQSVITTLTSLKGDD